MLKHRIIPVLLYDSRLMCVKPRVFQHPGRNVGSLMQFIKTMNTRNVDELILIDIQATKHNREPLFDKIKQFTCELFCPLTFGGGINKLEHIEHALRSGADKVCVNSALTDPLFIIEACQKFGSQCITAAVDVKLDVPHFRSQVPIYMPTTKCGTERIDMPLESFIQHIQELGIGEILLTAVHKDGTRAGYDKILIKKVKECCKVPLIANGGCESFSDMAEALKAGANAVAASSIFLFSGLTPINCSFYLENHGFPSRIEI